MRRLHFLRRSFPESSLSPLIDELSIVKGSSIMEITELFFS